MPVAIPFDEDGKAVLVPTFAPDGTALDEAAAIEQYKQTGKHFGKFDTPANATSYAAQLQQERAGAPTTTPAPVAPGAPTRPAPALTPPATTPAQPPPGVPLPARTQRVGAAVPPTPTPPAPVAPAPQMPGPPPMLSVEQVIARIPMNDPVTGAPLTPRQYELAQSIARTDHARMMAATEETRARLKNTLENGAAAMADGRSFNWSEPEVRSLIPQPEADQIVGKLRDAEKAGQFVGSIRVSTPADNEKHRAELLAGLSDPQAPDYEYRKRLLGIFETKLQEHEKQRDEDPAVYAYKYTPGVSDALNAAFIEQNRPAPPGATAVNPRIAETFNDYAQSTLAAQARLGVPEEKRRVLPNAMGADEVKRIAALDPTKTNPAQYMAGLAAKYGSGQGVYDHWPQVFGELVKNHKLPGEYQVLASMDRPDQAAAADDLGRALGEVAKKGGMAVIKQNAGEEVKAIDKELASQLEPFRLSAGLQSGGQELYDKVHDAARALSMYYAFRGKDGTAAVTAAVDGILGRKYDFPEIGGTTVRVPKDTGSTVSTAAERIQADINPSDLPPIPGQPLLSPAQRQEVWMSSIHDGGWVNNADDSGIVLMARLRDGAYIPVIRNDGSQVVLKFRDAPAYAYGEARSPPTTVLPPRATVAPQPVEGGTRLPGIVRSPAPTGTVLPPPMPPQPGLR